LIALTGLDQEELRVQSEILSPLISRWAEIEAPRLFNEEFLGCPDLGKERYRLEVIHTKLAASFESAKLCAQEMYVCLYCKFESTRIFDVPDFPNVLLNSLFAFYYIVRRMEEDRALYLLPQTVTQVVEKVGGLKLRANKDYRKEMTTKCLEGALVYTLLHATSLFEDFCDVWSWEEFVCRYPVFDCRQDRRVRETYYGSGEIRKERSSKDKVLEDRFYKSLERSEMEILWRVSSFMSIICELSDSKQTRTIDLACALVDPAGRGFKPGGDPSAWLLHLVYLHSQHEIARKNRAVSAQFKRVSAKQQKTPHVPVETRTYKPRNMKREDIGKEYLKQTLAPEGDSPTGKWGLRSRDMMGAAVKIEPPPKIQEFELTPHGPLPVEPWNGESDDIDAIKQIVPSIGYSIKEISSFTRTRVVGVPLSTASSAYEDTIILCSCPHINCFQGSVCGTLSWVEDDFDIIEILD
jgi:hypothetical protein